MEAINEFYIDLDLSGVTRMYDYEHSEYLTVAADGRWDLPDLHRRFGSQELLETTEDDTKQCRLRLMDSAFTARGTLEKDRRASIAQTKGKGGDADAPSDVFDKTSESELPYRLLPEIKPGGLVKGNLILDLKENIEAEKLTLSFKGGARVKIRVYHARGYYDDVGSEKYVDEDVVLFGDHDGAHDDHDDEGALLGGGSSGSKVKTTLPCGKHQFAFQFHLPEDAHAAVPPLVNSGHDYAHLVYRLKATIDRGKMMKRGNIVASRGIWVPREWDIAQIPEYLSPVTAEEIINTGVLRRSGRITCRAALERKAFVRGENIKCRLEIENGDSNPIIDVSARIVLGGRARAGTKTMSARRSIYIKSVKVAGDAVSGDSVSTQTLELPLEFTDIDNNLIPAGTLDDCGLIDVKYEIVVKLKRKGLHRNVELKIPVTIGTTNSSAFA